MSSSAMPGDLAVSLICYPFFPTKHSGRGVDRYTFELADKLAALGVRVSLPGVGHASTEGVLAAATKLARLVAALPTAHADVFHAVSTPSGATAALLRKRPLVVSVHDLLPFQVTDYNLRLKSSFARWSTTECVARADALIVPFQVTKDELILRHGADERKIHVVHFGLDHDTYYPRPEIPRAAREILYLGEVSRAKGVDNLIRAFGEVEKRLPDAKLLICGKPNRDQPGLEELCRSLAVKNIEFRGFVPEAELPSYYARATVMTFPSRNGFGLSTLEAMACRTPVVVVATLDAPEFIGDGGLMAKLDDPSDLARCLQRLLEDAALRDDLAQRGLERAKLFSWSEMARKTRAVYDAVRRPAASRRGESAWTGPGQGVSERNRM